MYSGSQPIQCPAFFSTIHSFFRFFLVALIGVARCRLSSGKLAATAALSTLSPALDVGAPCPVVDRPNRAIKDSGGGAIDGRLRNVGPPYRRRLIATRLG